MLTYQASNKSKARMEFNIPEPMASLEAGGHRSGVSWKNGGDQTAEFEVLPEPRTL